MSQPWSHHGALNSHHECVSGAQGCSVPRPVPEAPADSWLARSLCPPLFPSAAPPSLSVPARCTDPRTSGAWTLLPLWPPVSPHRGWGARTPDPSPCGGREEGCEFTRITWVPASPLGSWHPGVPCAYSEFLFAGEGGVQGPGMQEGTETGDGRGKQSPPCPNRGLCAGLGTDATRAVTLTKWVVSVLAAPLGWLGAAGLPGAAVEPRVQEPLAPVVGSATSTVHASVSP